jgi:hypothetical protein
MGPFSLSSKPHVKPSADWPKCEVEDGVSISQCHWLTRQSCRQADAADAFSGAFTSKGHSCNWHRAANPGCPRIRRDEGSNGLEMLAVSFSAPYTNPTWPICYFDDLIGDRCRSILRSMVTASAISSALPSLPCSADWKRCTETTSDRLRRRSLLNLTTKFGGRHPHVEALANEPAMDTKRALNRSATPSGLRAQRPVSPQGAADVPTVISQVTGEQSRRHRSKVDEVQTWVHPLGLRIRQGPQIAPKKILSMSRFMSRGPAAYCVKNLESRWYPLRHNVT